MNKHTYLPTCWQYPPRPPNSGPDVPSSGQHGKACNGGEARVPSRGGDNNQTQHGRGRRSAFEVMVFAHPCSDRNNARRALEERSVRKEV